MRSLRLLFVVLAVIVVRTATAQPGYTVKLTVANLTACTNSPALSLGTNASVNISGGSITGQITISEFSLTRVSDDCSIALYRALFMLTRSPTVTISAFNGATEVLRFTLSSAVVAGISESEASGMPPMEKVNFSFERIEVLDVLTGHHVGYDRRTGTAF